MPPLSARLPWGRWDTCPYQMPRLKQIIGYRPSPYIRYDLGPSPSEPRPVSNGRLSEGFAIEQPIPKLAEASSGYSGARPYARGSLASALALARASPKACARALREDVDAPSARASIASRISTWESIARSAGFSNPFLLTPDLVMTVMGVMKAANYRSAKAYLEVAKRLHIERGGFWSAGLHLAYRQAKRSCDRNLGPGHQAQPLALSLLASFPNGQSVHRTGPASPGRSALVASWWFLREIEARHARVSHITIDFDSLKADWKLPNSKTDHLALGTIRSHCCSCMTTARDVCPFHALVDQVGMAESLPENSQKWLFPTSSGGKSSKAGWSKTFVAIALYNGFESNSENGACRFSGHSARSSGAQHLVKLGIDLWRIQIFGRWSSDAFLKYIRESPLENLDKLATLATIHEAIRDAKAELQRIQNLHTAETAVPIPATPVAQISLDMIEEVAPPPLAIPANPSLQFVSNSATGGLVHAILVHGEDIHPRHWRARCNWHFGKGLTSFQMTSELPAGKQCKVCFNLPRETRQARPSSASSSSSSS